MTGIVITDREDTVRCPRCGGRDVRSSLRRGFLDSLMVALKRHPFRCRACKCRFYKSIPEKPEAYPADNPVGRDDSKVV
jgi:hypothetical protein